MTLRASLTRLAFQDGSLRQHLLPILVKTAKVPPSGHMVPKDVYQRAGRRWLDAVERKGLLGAVRATEIRIDRISPGSPKAEGIAQYLKAWMKEEKLKGAEKTAVKKLIAKAEAKARPRAASEKQATVVYRLSESLEDMLKNAWGHYVWNIHYHMQKAGLKGSNGSGTNKFPQSKWKYATRWGGNDSLILTHTISPDWKTITTSWILKPTEGESFQGSIRTKVSEAMSKVVDAMEADFKKHGRDPG